MKKSDFKRMPEEELKNLCRKIKLGDQSARNELVQYNMRLVNKIASRFQGMGLDYEDLCQEGYIGLIKAAERFDPEAGTTFSTYAHYWIIQQISRAVYNTGSIIRIPIYVHGKCKKTSLKIRNAQDIWGSSVNDDDLAAYFGISAEEISDLRNYDMFLHTSSLDEPLKNDDDDNGVTLSDTIRADAPEPYEVTETAIINNALINSVLSLNDRERFVIIHRFGLFDTESCSLDKLGKAMGVTKERVRQIQISALKHLRNDPELNKYAA